MISEAQALAAIKLQKNNMVITPAGVKDLLSDLKGTTFAEVVQVTPVKLAAAHEKAGVVITKVTVANVQLFNGLKDYDIYANAVKRSATALGETNTFNVREFEAAQAWFEHTDCFSVVRKRSEPEKHYLYAIYNRGESVYVKDGKVVDKELVASYMTKSAAAQLLDPPSTNYNVSQDVTHNITVRAVGLDNVVGIKAMGYELTVKK